jgi:hypothetical protein
LHSENNKLTSGGDGLEDKKNKGKKNDKSKKEESAAERRAREKKERESAKAEEKAGTQQVKVAQSIIMKIGAPLLNCRGVIDNPNFNFVAASIKDPLMGVFGKLQRLREQCEEVVHRGNGAVDADVKTVALDLCSLRQQMALATSMIVLMERSSRTRT